MTTRKILAALASDAPGDIAIYRERAERLEALARSLVYTDEARAELAEQARDSREKEDDIRRQHADR